MEYKAKTTLDEQILAAVEVLLSGGVVAFPTDTVYGLGAIYTHAGAARRIYKIKSRSQTNALPLIIADYEQLMDITIGVNEYAQVLMEAFWPGPLTLILPKSDKVGHDITGGLDTVAVRMPGHQVPLQLAGRTGQAICGTSANISGRKSPVSSMDVRNQLGNKIDYLISVGNEGSGIPSTIVDVTGKKPIIIREGTITAVQINSVYQFAAKEVGWQ